jgi:hypothetical protein
MPRMANHALTYYLLNLIYELYCHLPPPVVEYGWLRIFQKVCSRQLRRRGFVTGFFQRASSPWGSGLLKDKTEEAKGPN